MAVAASQGVEEKALNGGKEADQPMQGVQAIQDPKTFELPTSQGPQFKQTPSPIETVLPQMGSSTKTLGGASSFRQTGNLYSFIIVFYPISYGSFFSSLPEFFFFFFFSFSLSGQVGVRSASSAASSLESENFEGGH